MRARHQLLAGAGLAVDEHRGVGGRDLLDGLEHAAHRPRCRRRSRRSGTAPRRPRASAAFSASARSRARRSPRSSSARSTFSRTTSGANGFCRKSNAPSLIASTAVSTVPKAVTIMHAGSRGRSSRTACSTSSPSTPLHLEVGDDEVGAGGLPPADAREPLRPGRRQAPPRGPCAARSRARPSRIVSLSSMMRIRAISSRQPLARAVRQG